MDLLLRNNGGRDRRPKYTIFVVWKTPNADGRVVMSLGGESCLRPVEISCVCFVCCFGCIPECEGRPHQLPGTAALPHSTGCSLWFIHGVVLVLWRVGTIPGNRCGVQGTRLYSSALRE